MNKNSFTLFEILISLILLSIIISGISKLFVNDDYNSKYNELQIIENNYIEHKVINNSENIKFRTF